MSFCRDGAWDPQWKAQQLKEPITDKYVASVTVYLSKERVDAMWELASKPKDAN